MRNTLLALALLFIIPLGALGQEEDDSTTPFLDIGGAREAVVNRALIFDSASSTLPDAAALDDVRWDFGDGVRTNGPKVTHAYTNPGTYTVTATLITDEGELSNSTEVRIAEDVILLVVDGSVPIDQIELARQQAREHDLLLVVVAPPGNVPEVITEDSLVSELLNHREDIAAAHLIVTWTNGAAGANTLSRLAQEVTIDFSDKGIALLASTPFSVLSPTAQSVFDQLLPEYVVLARPEALSVFLTTEPTAEAARTALLDSPLERRLLGPFSARTISETGLTNFMSSGVTYLINRGVPVNSITLILMLPLIATILAFARQVIGIKAFGLITPAITTLAFLVLGLQYGLIVFATMLLTGTVTRLLLRRLHLLYLPRMAIVLSAASLGLLVLLGIGASIDRALVSSFSIFPALILIILAEEFVAVQFKSGARSAATITAWTLALSITGYYIVSWELLRTLLISYPEIILLTLPINILIGRWTGLRLTEYVRFRELLRHE